MTSANSTKTLLAVVAVAVLGGTLFARLWTGAAREDQTRRVERLLAASGAKPVERALDLARVDVPLEALPATGIQGSRKILGGLLADHPVVLLNFWASWCPPCLDELRSLQRLGKLLRPYGVQIVAVSYDDDWPAQQRVFRELLGTDSPPHVLWTRDPQGQEGDAAKMMRTALGTEKLPETWVLRGGQIVSRFVGAQDWSKPEVVRYLGAVAQSAP